MPPWSKAEGARRLDGSHLTSGPHLPPSWGESAHRNGRPRQTLSSRITFSTNAIASAMVQRSRLRSASEPPPNGPAPVPHAEGAGQPGVLAGVQEHGEDEEERQDDLHAGEHAHEHGPRLPRARRRAVGRQLVQLAQDGDGLRAQLAVDAPVVVGESLPVRKSSSVSRISR